MRKSLMKRWFHLWFAQSRLLYTSILFSFSFFSLFPLWDYYTLKNKTLSRVCSIIGFQFKNEDSTAPLKYFSEEASLIYNRRYQNLFYNSGQFLLMIFKHRLVKLSAVVIAWEKLTCQHFANSWYWSSLHNLMQIAHFFNNDRWQTIMEYGYLVYYKQLLHPSCTMIDTSMIIIFLRIRVKK